MLNTTKKGSDTLLAAARAGIPYAMLVWNSKQQNWSVAMLTTNQDWLCYFDYSDSNTAIAYCRDDNGEWEIVHTRNTTGEWEDVP